MPYVFTGIIRCVGQTTCLQQFCFSLPKHFFWEEPCLLKRIQVLISFSSCQANAVIKPTFSFNKTDLAKLCCWCFIGSSAKATIGEIWSVIYSQVIPHSNWKWLCLFWQVPAFPTTLAWSVSGKATGLHRTTAVWRETGGFMIPRCVNIDFTWFFEVLFVAKLHLEITGKWGVDPTIYNYYLQG